jgi:hypothetical protein
MLSSLLVLTGCANDPQVIEKAALQKKQEEIHIPQNKSLLYIVRPEKVAASGQHYIINIQGKSVAVMKTGTYFPYLIQSGKIDNISKKQAKYSKFWSCLGLYGRAEIITHNKSRSNLLYQCWSCLLWWSYTH